MNAAAAETAGQLVADRPEDSLAYYELWAAAERREGRQPEQLEVWRSAVRAFPESFRAHEAYCWYGALFFDESERVLRACDRAIELASTAAQRAAAHARRSLPRALEGRTQDAVTDLDAAFEAWRAAGVDPDRFPQPWKEWLGRLRAGDNPFDERTLELERSRF